MPEKRRPETAPLISARSLMDAAREATGLDDLGGDEVARRFRALVGLVSLMPDSPEEGPSGGAQMLYDVLVARLRFVGDRHLYPAMLDNGIEAPFIAMGLARSGTTFLHALLAQDEANRAPRYWEVRDPSPPPGLARADDPRLRDGASVIEEMVAASPGLLQAHPYFDMGAMTLMECEHFWRTDAFFRGFLSTDLEVRYAFHRELLQHLQWGAQPRRWVLKGVQHQYRLDHVRETYPDGLLVWIHRDPIRVIASQAEYHFLEAGPVPEEQDQRAAVAKGVDRLRSNLDGALASPHATGAGICHVLYRDLKSDPVLEIGRIYEYFGLPFTKRFERSIAAWTADRSNRPDRYGAFQYSLDRFGLDAAELERRFADYRDRFAIPYEGL